MARIGSRPSIAAVDDQERIQHYVIMSGFAAQSVDAVRDDFPRWIRRLCAEGAEIPDSPVTASAEASNLINMFLHQVRPERDERAAHELRNLANQAGRAVQALASAIVALRPAEATERLLLRYPVVSVSSDQGPRLACIDCPIQAIELNLAIACRKLRTACRKTLLYQCILPLA